MGRRPIGKYSIERRDNDAGYSPGNCKWAEPTEQARNRSNTIWVTLNGERRRLVELVGLDNKARSRYRRGWPIENILSGVSPRQKKTKPVREKKKIVRLEPLDEKPSDLKSFVEEKRRQGLPLRCIGELLAVSRQRVHQIINP